MKDRIIYYFSVKEKLPTGRSKVVVYSVEEANTKLGSAIATGKCCRFFEDKIANREIMEYRIIL